jgi:hypothetical protein
VYFASRDDRNRSHIGWVEIAIGPEPTVTAAGDAPVLAPGPLGNFDDHGVYPASIVESDGRLLLYYIGWNPGATPPLFYASIGLAESDDGGLSFRRVHAGPILGRSDHDPTLVTSPCVRESDGRWRMWYVSGLRWSEDSEGLHSHYHVKYAESDDGTNWVREGRVCIDLEPGERNIARPWVVEDGGRHRMWYAHAGDRYRLGYAESSDAVEWERRDADVGIEPSESGWDSEAMAYPWVEAGEDGFLMLYKGNDYGRTGFGVAAATR